MKKMKSGIDNIQHDNSYAAPNPFHCKMNVGDFCLKGLNMFLVNGTVAAGHVGKNSSAHVVLKN